MGWWAGAPHWDLALKTPNLGCDSIPVLALSTKLGALQPLLTSAQEVIEPRPRAQAKGGIKPDQKGSGA